MDILETERVEGRTYEVGITSIDTDQKSFTVLDTPGSQRLVP